MANARRVLPQTPWSSSHKWLPSPTALTVLLCALTVFGLGEALIIQSYLGASPWAVLSLGVANHVPLSVGTVTLIISILVFLLWIPLHIRPGLGSVLNIIVIALSIDLGLWLFPAPDALWAKWVYCVSGVVITGIASSFYLTCQMGAGPRDGLMMGIWERTGWKVGIVRNSLEVTVCFIGWLLGGTVGPGTLLFAFGVGYVVQFSLSVINRFDMQRQTR